MPERLGGSDEFIAPSIIGNSNRNALPTPSWLRTDILPPCALTTPAATQTPREDASVALASSKIRPVSGSSMAAPVSWTMTWTTLPAALVPAFTCRADERLDTWTALRRRFTSASLACSTSSPISGTSGEQA